MRVLAAQELLAPLLARALFLGCTVSLIVFSLLPFSFGRLEMIGEILVKEQGRLTGVTGTEVDGALLGMEDAGW